MILESDGLVLHGYVDDGEFVPIPRMTLNNDVSWDDDVVDVNDDWEGDSISGVGIMEGATSLEQCVERLFAYAEYLESLIQDGWKLTLPVEGDFGMIRQSDKDEYADS